MKNLCLLLIFAINLIHAGDMHDETPVIDKLPKEYALSIYRTKSQLLNKLPMPVVDMVSTFPETLDLVMGCFDYPKIKILACQEMAKVDHPGSAWAKHNLGISYAEGGEGLTQSHTEAFYWYLRAANQGLDSSMHNLARMYEFGLGVQVSLEMAYRLYRRADDASWHGHKASFDRAAILTLVELNRQVNEGVTPYAEKLKFMSLLEPWQIEAADKYFD
ncbi:tetratricopeptide repeat protein [Methylophilaceae bacterium]|nr:tetratricopeptide repeat protein [Methylophilaceae bacterium]